MGKTYVPSGDMPPRVAILRSLTPIPDDGFGSWSRRDKSKNITLRNGGRSSEDRLWIRRNNVASSTDAARGKASFTSGVHLFEFTWHQRHRGTHAVVGVATKHAPLHTTGYRPLVGSNKESYGWELKSNCLLHDTDDTITITDEKNDNQLGTERIYNDGNKAPNSFEAVLDMDEGTLAFIANGTYLGIAFHGLHNKKLFPIISCVWGFCEIRMRHLASLPALPSLFNKSANTIRRNIRNISDMLLLPLPRPIIKHLEEGFHNKEDTKNNKDEHRLCTIVITIPC